MERKANGVWRMAKAREGRLVILVRLVLLFIWFILFPEQYRQEKPNKPERPDKPDPRHAPRDSVFVSLVVLISQYSRPTLNSWITTRSAVRDPRCGCHNDRGEVNNIRLGSRKLHLESSHYTHDHFH